MSEGMYDLLGDMMGQQLEEMNATRDKFTEDMERSAAESADVFNRFQNRVFGNRRGHKAPELPADVKKLVDTMLAVPALVPVLTAKAGQYMADVNAAFEAINAKHTATPPTDGTV